MHTDAGAVFLSAFNGRLSLDWLFFGGSFEFVSNPEDLFNQLIYEIFAGPL